MSPFLPYLGVTIVLGGLATVTSYVIYSTTRTIRAIEQEINEQQRRLEQIGELLKRIERMNDSCQQLSQSLREHAGALDPRVKEVERKKPDLQKKLGRMPARVQKSGEDLRKARLTHRNSRQVKNISTTDRHKKSLRA